MNDLPIVKLGAGYVIDVTSLDKGDTVVIFSEIWPHNFSNIDFKQISQYHGAQDDRVFVGRVLFKPSQAFEIKTDIEPRVIVLKGKQ